MREEYNTQVAAIQTFYTVEDVRRIFCCGTEKAYEIAFSQWFPKMIVGRRILIQPDALQTWINQHKNLTVNLR
jgi:hypothetical protein